jgi:hypothetical protein
MEKAPHVVEKRDVVFSRDSVIVSKVRTSFFWVFVGFWISVAVALSVGSFERSTAFISL